MQVIQAKYRDAEVTAIQATYSNAGFGGGRCRVVIRSDRGSIKVGEALSSPGEVKWLSGVLIHVLASVFP